MSDAASPQAVLPHAMGCSELEVRYVPAGSNVSATCEEAGDCGGTVMVAQVCAEFVHGFDGS